MNLKGLEMATGCSLYVKILVRFEDDFCQLSAGFSGPIEIHSPEGGRLMCDGVGRSITRSIGHQDSLKILREEILGSLVKHLRGKIAVVLPGNEKEFQVLIPYGLAVE